MNTQLFKSIFQDMTIPVIVCRDDAALSIVHENVSALTLFNPFVRMGEPDAQGALPPLHSVLRFEAPGAFSAFEALLRSRETIESHIATLLTYEGVPLPASLTVNRVDSGGEVFRVLYLHTTQQDSGSMLYTALHLANSTPVTSDAINSILALAGRRVKASRCYIFESISDTLSSNTYEWCASEALPAIHMLQGLPKSEYSYQEIIDRGLFAVDDIVSLNAADRAVLEPQGIRALATIPIFSGGKPMGYLGFDDCEKPRVWTQAEILILRELAALLASLLVRRDMMRSARKSVDILQIITDNTDIIVYVSDIHTHELIFVNKPMAEQMGGNQEDMVGRPCWSILQRGMTGPCPFCPIPKMARSEDGEPTGTYAWEFQNTVNGKWYLVRDAIITWIDGRDVHMETATEITHKKVFEEQLMHIASVDKLTGLYNRDWGHKMITQELAARKAGAVSLVFADVDGLKPVNDTLGHEAGDAMLCAIGDILSASVRKSDTVCRWGGDEFILLLQCSPQQAEHVMETVQRNIEQENRSGKHPFTLSLSHGIMGLDPELGLEAVVAEADKRMYESKQAKKARRAAGNV